MIYLCKWCREYFKRFRCNAPNECDCPECQGYCQCHASGNE